MKARILAGIVRASATLADFASSLAPHEGQIKPIGGNRRINAARRGETFARKRCSGVFTFVSRPRCTSAEYIRGPVNHDGFSSSKKLYSS